MDAGGSGEVHLEVRVEASPKTVFALLTDPEQLKTWIADLVVAEPRAGGQFRASGSLGTIEGAYVEVISDTKVVFTWGGVEGVAPGQSTVDGDAATSARLRSWSFASWWERQRSR